MNKILIIEDDTAIAEIERDFLEINGFKVLITSDGVTGLSLAQTDEFNLILLDVMLPGVNGYDICKKIRSCKDIPIIMVTAKTEDIDKIRGLGLGADDYIVKPFSPTELVARVKAHIARYERLTGRTDELLTAGEIKINERSRRVYVRDVEVELKNKEYELLSLLVTNPDMVFSKETLYERIWGMDAYGDIKTVVVHINRIREKVEKDPTNPVHIETVWGVGYRYKI